MHVLAQPSVTSLETCQLRLGAGPFGFARPLAILAKPTATAGVPCLASRNRLAIMSKPTPKGDWSERRLCQIVNFPRRSLPELSNATTRVTPQKDHERKAGDDDVVDVAGIEPVEYVRS